MSDALRITIRFPQPLDKVSRLLAVLGAEWPDVKADTSDPQGWYILVPADGQTQPNDGPEAGD